MGKNLFARYYLELNSDYRNSIFLAGTGRSGTTWVSSIINYDNFYRDIFEPFHSYEVELVKDFNYRQYLRPENQEEKFLRPTQCILSGRVKSKWTDQFNHKFFCQKRLIKDIRANFFLYWMYKHFPEVPIILLLRHPGAVVNSKMHLGWENHLQSLLAQSELVEDFLYPFKDEIEKAQTDFEKQIFFWCIENYVPLKQFSSREIHLAFYENFCTSPQSEIEKMFNFLGKRFDESVFLKLKQPSAVSRKESAIVTGINVLDSWRKHITDDQLKKMIEIMRLFGLDKIYSHDSLPNVDGAYDLMRKI